MRTVLILLLLTAVLVIVMRCNPRGINSAEEVTGEYLFKYKSGEIETVIINKDMTYTHFLFANSEAYQRKTPPVLVNNGTWYYDGNKLFYKGWLMLFDFKEDGALLKTPFIVLKNGFWYEPNTSGYKNATIWFHDEIPLYILERTK